jgi:hypothetical protein
MHLAIDNYDVWVAQRHSRISADADNYGFGSIKDDQKILAVSRKPKTLVGFRMLFSSNRLRNYRLVCQNIKQSVFGNTRWNAHQ